MITQLHGDNLAILPTLAPRSIQALITSPAYYGLRSYKIPPSAWPEVTYCPLIGLPPVVIPAMQCQLGAEPDPLAYIGHLVHVFRLARPALRGDGTLWVNLADSYSAQGGPQVNGTKQTKGSQDGAWGGASRNGVAGIPDKNLLGIPHRAALALQADGWVWRSEIIWNAPNKMPESVRDRPTRAHEQVLLFGVGPRYYYDQDAVREPLADDTLKKNGIGADGKGYPVNNRSITPDVYGIKEFSGNMKPGASRSMNPAGRNKRTVWEIPTAPMPTKLRGTDDAHYAAWPPALVEIMVKASTCNKACAACGAAWVRQVEREQRPRGDAFGKKQIGKDFDHGQGGRAYMETIAVRTTGFTPACACAAGVGRCVVLDPFAGTGTTMSVCESLGRDSIGIDLGYQELQQKRTDNLQIAMEAFI